MRTPQPRHSFQRPMVIIDVISNLAVWPPRQGDSFVALTFTNVNSYFQNRVSDPASVLFPTGTPVPLTAWKVVTYSPKAGKFAWWCGITAGRGCTLVG